MTAALEQRVEPEPNVLRVKVSERLVAELVHDTGKRKLLRLSPFPPFTPEEQDRLFTCLVWARRTRQQNRTRYVHHTTVPELIRLPVDSRWLLGHIERAIRGRRSDLED